jgi:hypothetical protein
MLNQKSHIFADVAIGKGVPLFCNLTKTIAIRAGADISPALFCFSE